MGTVTWLALIVAGAAVTGAIALIIMAARATQIRQDLAIGFSLTLDHLAEIQKLIEQVYMSIPE